MNILKLQQLAAVLAAASAAAVAAAAAAAAAAEFEALVLFISVLLAALMVQVSWCRCNVCIRSQARICIAACLGATLQH
jgi:hypothetical protein